MKRILITGASGTIGFSLVNQLIELNEYEVTALDLKSPKAIKKLKKISKDINVIYGDINEEVLMDSLVKDHDVIIHLAGIIPPFADIKSNLCRVVDYEGTKNLVRAIKENNPKCFLLFASTTTIYGNRPYTDEIKVSDEVRVDSDDNYALVKLRCEEIIEENLKKYSIFRLSAVLSDIKNNTLMYNIPLKSRVEFITADDAARAFINALPKTKEINKKIFNITGGDPCRTTFKNFLKTILKIHGISIRFIGTWTLVDKNFYSGFYADSDDAHDILKFREDSLDDYYKKQNKKTNKILRLIPILLAIPFILAFRRRRNNK